MSDLLNQVKTILYGMWKYRRLGVSVAWLVAAAVALAVMMIPDRYEATARVYVNTQSILRPLMSGLAVQPNIEQQVTMLSRTLISRPTVEKLIRMSDLDLQAKSKEEQEALIQRVTDALSIRSTGRDNLYTLSYRGDSPASAQSVVQSLLTIFVESSLGDSKSDTESARRFIEDQIKSYESKLTEAETRLKQFRLRNIDVQTQGGLDMAGRMTEISTALSQARLELREALSAREVAQRQLEQIRTDQRVITQPSSIVVATPEIDGRIEVLQRNLDALLQRYTDQHPDVLNTRRLIRELEEQKRREVAELQRKAAANPGLSRVEAHPAQAELTRVLAATEVQVASLRARVAEFEARSSQARVQMRVAPQMEAELAQLNRDYEIHRRNYEDLVGRRESLVIGGDLESASNLADFRVIDPPRADSKPVAPNRVLMMPMALIAALASGLGVAFLMGQLRPVYFDALALRNGTSLPLLGVVTLIKNDAVRARESRSLLRFLASVLGLVAVFGLGMVALSYYSGLGR
ncbi:MAG: chain length-determining protein [Comamonadaceae bacterium]|nr:chain length-determining protein [Comamonadaceae bacterium]